MAAKVSGLAVTYVAAGFVLLWSGLKNDSVKDTITSFAKGAVPAGNPTGGPTVSIASTGSPGSPYASYVGGSPPDAATVAGYKAYAQGLLALHGWPGQMASFNSIVMGESSWNPTARNPTSGAFGIAQALGHGQGAATAAGAENNYGNFGTSAAVCKAANGGSGTAQIQWMCNYIAATYGSVDAAWAFHQAHGSY